MSIDRKQQAQDFILHCNTLENLTELIYKQTTADNEQQQQQLISYKAGIARALVYIKSLYFLK